MAMPEKITAWKDATERFGAWHETQAGQGAAGDERFYIRADLVDDLVKACLMASSTGVHIGRGEYSISQEAMQAIDAALNRIKGDVT